ncbi:MAG TPA: hypothetical protein VHA78_05485 [Candidatus Peribacteraceae bacterium]|nr:hypothetical protein [Candidatus Peribacteraceae bacterium]
MEIGDVDAVKSFNDLTIIAGRADQGGVGGDLLFVFRQKNKRTVAKGSPGPSDGEQQVGRSGYLIGASVFFLHFLCRDKESGNTLDEQEIAETPHRVKESGISNNYLKIALLSFS